MRYRLLETIREYALSKLREAGEEEQGRTRHLEYLRDFVESVEPRSMIAWPMASVRRLEGEYTNIVAALEWAGLCPENAESGLRLVGALPEQWFVRKQVNAAGNALRNMLTSTEVKLPDQVRAKALIGMGSMAALFRCDYAEAYRSYELSLKLFRELDDKTGIAGTLYYLGYFTGAMFDLENSRRYLEECLTICRAIEDPCGIALSLQDLGNISCWQGETAFGRGMIEESLNTLNELGMDHWAARAMMFLGNIARREGDFGRARSLYGTAMNMVKEGHFRLLGSFIGVEVFGFLAAAERRYERAACLFGAVERIAQELGTSLTPADLVEHEVYVAAASAALGEDRFKGAWEAGRKLTSRQAVAYALAADESAQACYGLGGIDFQISTVSV